MTIISASKNDDKIIIDSDIEYIGNVDDGEGSIAVNIEDLQIVEEADDDEISEESNNVQLIHFDGETMV